MFVRLYNSVILSFSIITRGIKFKIVVNISELTVKLLYALKGKLQKAM